MNLDDAEAVNCVQALCFVSGKDIVECLSGRLGVHTKHTGWKYLPLNILCVSYLSITQEVYNLGGANCL